MLVDDSALIRRLTSAALRSDPGVVVANTAENGKAALEIIERDRPDIVLLDVEMPVMDGLTTLRNIKRRWPKLPVLMFSTLTAHGARITIEALAAGADDYVTKPSGTGNPAAALERVRSEVLPKMKAICRPKRIAAPVLPAMRPRVAAAPSGGGGVDVLAIGTSTGGPNALIALLGGLATLPVPVLIVQHMPPSFTAMLAERLDRSCTMPVTEASTPTRVVPGHVYLAVGGRHLQVERRDGGVWAVQTDAAPENSCRPAVDVLFRSVAEVYANRVLGVVLTGMGSDGCVGSEAIVRRGGTVLAQDEESSVVWGMPGSVARAGLAERILPIDKISAEIGARISRPRPVVAAHRPSATTGVS
jgi:two-component system chemotaxis response regulator CheB